jgi:PadR family transcriptional regulator, regulatory protein PadR
MERMKGMMAYCDMRGFLSFLILFFLSKKPMNGKQLSEELERRKGIRPSPGTIYPALKSLREAGMIKEKKSGKSIEYTLTKKGKDELHAAKNCFCRMFSGVM